MPEIIECALETTDLSKEVLNFLKAIRRQREPAFLNLDKRCTPPPRRLNQNDLERASRDWQRGTLEFSLKLRYEKV